MEVDGGWSAADEASEWWWATNEIEAELVDLINGWGVLEFRGFCEDFVKAGQPRVPQNGEEVYEEGITSPSNSPGTGQDATAE